MAKLEKYQSYKSSWHPNIVEMVMSYGDDSGGAAGVYSISTVIPAGSYLLDVQVHADTLWNSGTSAALIVGDSDDPNGFFDAVNLKATDLVDNEVLSFYHYGSGSEDGAYITSANGVMTQYSSSARTVSAQVTTVGVTTAGVTRIVVMWAKPTDTVLSSFAAS
mgnify:FL=1|jgi:hypothetical protein|tara:strand:- start:203 stop:691 length:489 start_codon:yes stop_codon:yes gene_type:complete